ncbi:flagellar hook-basal body complex protein FliE [Elioraea thermophila]|uniref:flagellar hook-basal body complex protein FliE n=1 Tax=Elioraea thermophila TaxID=2185104 RepID=UPI000DF437DE|nr:flagellar hook-basal body complex protein FliE [Elioraea thermophila]
MATVSTAAAAARYAAAASAATGETGATPVPGPEAVGFGQVLENALAATVRSVKEADAKAMQAVAGAADITDVVTAVARAELALQTTVAIRDRVIQAYQEVMRMPI